jgi:5'-3' exonuclease
VRSLNPNAGEKAFPVIARPWLAEFSAQNSLWLAATAPSEFLPCRSYLAADGATEVGAVRAMGVWLARFLRDVSPRYVAVAFDVDRSSTFRRKLMPEYKAQRPPYPQDLLLQVS